MSSLEVAWFPLLRKAPFATSDHNSWQVLVLSMGEPDSSSAFYVSKHLPSLPDRVCPSQRHGSELAPLRDHVLLAVSYNRQVDTSDMNCSGISVVFT